ncbi:MAG: DUF1598 domain-containing protein [Pseudomonadota bacterium]
MENSEERVALSLSVLSKQVEKAIQKNLALPKELRNLNGIGFVEGFVVVDEPEEKDVILVGRRSKSRPSLKLDDIIVNMRTASSYPYCSLVPYPKNILALQTLMNNSPDTNSPLEIKAFFKRLKSTVGPQQIVVGGVPRNSRLAHIMIEADYHMKKVSQGHIKLPQVTSYLERPLNEIKQQILKGETVPMAGESMARFWFHIGPNSPTFIEEKDIVWLDKSPVVLLTEKQMATPSGELYDVDDDDPHAIAFANEMSQAFPMSVPIYEELENLFRLRALLLAMGHRQALSVLKYNLSSYLSEYQYQEEKPMPSNLPGLANYKEWSHEVQSGNLISRYYLFPMVFGGVGMDMPVNRANFSQGGEQVSAVRVAALRARPSREALSWVVLGNE